MTYRINCQTACTAITAHAHSDRTGSSGGHTCRHFSTLMLSFCVRLYFSALCFAAVLVARALRHLRHGFRPARSLLPAQAFGDHFALALCGTLAPFPTVES